MTPNALARALRMDTRSADRLRAIACEPLHALDDTPRDAEVIALDDEDPVLCQWCDEPGRYRAGEIGPLCDDHAPTDDYGPGLLMRDRLMAQGL